jgi:hypothetical protein
MPTDRTFSLPQLAFATLVVFAFVFLTYTDKVSGDATIALVSAITGGVLGAPLAARAGAAEAHANGVLEGASTTRHDLGAPEL